jgi:predicted amidohydrolase YtcJ
LDGEVESHNAALLEPYRDEPSAFGETAFTQNALNLLVEKLHQHGLPIIVRAKGDRAVRMALDAYEKLGKAPKRHRRIDGIDIISRVDIPRLADLGALACLQPCRASPDFASSWDRFIGPLRLERALAFKSLEASGALLAFGSRWPAFDLDPMLGIHAAVNRRNLDGKPERGWNPDERLSLEEALSAYTMRGVDGRFDADIRGTLEEGKPADIVVLSEDLFRIPARRIAEIEAVMTIVGGRTVYLSPGFVPKETEDILLGWSYNNR